MRHFPFFRIILSAVLPALLLLNSTEAQKLETDKLKEMKVRSIGPAKMSGRVTAVEAVVDNPSIIYIGTASGGVWKSTSGGTSWKPVFDDEKVQNIGALAITQSNPDVVWVGTGEGNPRNSLNLGAGIYKSLDAGKTWTLMGLEKTRNIHRIIIDPRDENTVYAGAHGNPWTEHQERGVYKTTDGGKTWEKILYVDTKTGVADLVMDPSNPNKLLAAMWQHRRWPWYFESGGPGSGLYVTVDGGKTCKERTSRDGLPEGDLGRMGLAIAPSNPEIIYALVEAKKNALYRSTDGGQNWKMVSEGDGAISIPTTMHGGYIRKILPLSSKGMTAAWPYQGTGVKHGRTSRTCPWVSGTTSGWITRSRIMFTVDSRTMAPGGDLHMCGDREGSVMSTGRNLCSATDLMLYRTRTMQGTDTPCPRKVTLDDTTM